jgi:RND family efflux transporter MFP subunit
MKRGVLIFVGSLLLTMGFCVNAAVPVTVMDLKTVKPVDTFYTGELEAIEQGILSFEEAGYLETIVPVGEYVFSEIKDDVTGQVLRKGTVIAQQKTDKQEYELKVALMSKKIAESDFLAAKRDYDRNSKLADRSIVSKKDFNDSKTALMNSKLGLDKATSEVMIKQYLLDRATIMAPFSGIVTKTFMQAGGRAGDGDDAIEVTKMSPLLIKIPFPRDIIDKFREGTQVQVYPAGSSEPVEAWCNTSINNDVLYAYINNEVTPTIKLTPAQEKMKKVYKIFPVISISDSGQVIGELGKFINYYPKDNVPLAVPLKAIRKDDKGTYVLKIVKSESDLLQFSVKKEYIQIGEIKREFNLGLSRKVEIQSLKDAKGLTTSDLIVLTGDEGIEDGETVVKENVRWKFMPGQLVKLAVPALNNPGIYVPANAVIHQADGDNYVYLVDGGKAKLTKVDIIGRSSGYNRIIGNDVKDGAQVVIMDRDKEFSELYDGVSVETKKTLPAPVRITKPRADELMLPVADIEGSYYGK